MSGPLSFAYFLCDSCRRFKGLPYFINEEPRWFCPCGKVGRLLGTGQPGRKAFEREKLRGKGVGDVESSQTRKDEIAARAESKRIIRVIANRIYAINRLKNDRSRQLSFELLGKKLDNGLLRYIRAGGKRDGQQRDS